MREYVQVAGVRRWHGDELVGLQAEALAALQGLVEPAGPCVITGCQVSGSNISAGLVGIGHADGYKIARFAGATGVTFPAYMSISKTVNNKLYDNGNNLQANSDYVAVLTGSAPAVPYITFGPSGGIPYVEALRSKNLDVQLTVSWSTAGVNGTAGTLKLRRNKMTGIVYMRGTITVTSAGSVPADPPLFYPITVTPSIPTDWLPVDKHLFHALIRYHDNLGNGLPENAPLFPSFRDITGDISQSSFTIGPIRSTDVSSYTCYVSTMWSLD